MWVASRVFMPISLPTNRKMPSTLRWMVRALRIRKISLRVAGCTLIVSGMATSAMTARVTRGIRVNTGKMPFQL